MNDPSTRSYRRELANRLRENAEEIEEAILDRILALEDSTNRWRKKNLQSLVAPLLRCAIESIEFGEHQVSKPPPEAMAHARKAAWRAMSTRILQDRYLAGYTVFKGFVRREHNRIRPRPPTLPAEVHGSADTWFERLFRAVGDEHEQEVQNRDRSTEALQLERIKGLLSGSLIEAPELAYPLNATHVGFVGSGAGVFPSVSRIADSLGGAFLMVRPSLHQFWAWIGTQRSISALELRTLLEATELGEARVAVGDPASGLRGWRLTHQQAVTAFPVAETLDRGFAQYARFALLASALGDELLIHSLLHQYLLPLSTTRDGGKALRETLRAYFSVGGNISSAASQLGVRRHTVANRIQAAEKIFGYPIRDCGPEVELALRIEAISGDSLL